MLQSLRNLPASRVNLLVALGLAAFALGLRLIGITWGLPNELHNQPYHPDELLNWQVAQAIEPSKLDFTPNFYNYGTLYFTLIRVASDVSSAYGGEASSPWRAIGSSIMAGRVLSALAGAGTVLIVFFGLRRLTNLLGASMGAALVAVAPAHVVHSRFLTADVIATFLIAVAVFFAFRTLPPREGEEAPKVLKMAIWSGIFAGLSASTKYSGVLALIVLFCILILHRPAKWGIALGSALAACIGAFMLTTPGALLETESFLRDFRYELVHTATGHGFIFTGVSSGFAFHFLNLVVGVGLLLTLLGLGGLGWASAQKQTWGISALVFFVLYYILIGRAEIYFIRYTFPLLIPLALGFGWLTGMAHERKGWGIAVVMAGILGLGGLDAGGLRSAATYTAWMGAEDPRDEAAKYLKSLAETKPGMSVGLVSDPWYYTPPLYPDSTAGPSLMPIQRRLEEMQAARGPNVVRYVPDDVNARFDWDVRLLTESLPDYVVYSSFEWEEGPRLLGLRRLEGDAKVRASQVEAFFEVLRRDYEPHKLFGAPAMLVHDLQYIRPIIWIWQRKTQP